MEQGQHQSRAKRKASQQVWRTTWQQALTALTIGWDLALPIFGGVLLGHYVDRQSGGGYTFAVGLLVLGLAMGVHNMRRALERELRHHRASSSELTGAEALRRAQEEDQHAHL